MQHPNHADHADHDLTLIAGHAADDLSDTDRARAQAILDTCPSCAEVRADLVAIAVATGALPNLASAPRDFRLTPDQAARLARRGWLRTILAPFSAPGSATRPMAAAFTSLGLVGLLVATFLPGMLGSASFAPTGAGRAQGTLEGGAIGVPAATAAPAAPAGGPGELGPGAATLTPDDASVVKGGDTPTTNPEAPPNFESTSGPKIAVGGYSTQAPGEVQDAVGGVNATPTPSLVLIGSLVLLALGLLLFGLRFAGRRLR